MARQILIQGNNSKNNTKVTLNPRQSTNTSKQLSQDEKLKLDKLLRKPRSKRYMDAMSKLDAGGHVRNRSVVEEIIKMIRSEFPEVEIESILLGIVDVCYLGAPYEVHTLDITGEIIEHYKSGQTLPGGLEKARSIAMRGGYDFIEVYIDCCRAISSNGTVSVIPC
ncbi:MAG: hypothetical protein GX802_06105 [Clostridiales bacterium]|jgi:hypothetical protein|nr:hypothetical protein [Clostridiales bacterium]